MKPQKTSIWVFKLLLKGQSPGKVTKSANSPGLVFYPASKNDVNSLVTVKLVRYEA